jgi:tetratricopeptide (TPR) repeat protein
MKTMRRKTIAILTTVFATLIIFSSCSDKMYVNRAELWAKDNEKLDTALSSVNKATKLEDTKNWPKTYYVKGFVYQKIYENENFKDVAEKPKFKAFDNYKKAYEMDKEKEYQAAIKLQMMNLRKYFANDGVKAFNENKDYEKALENFEYAIKISEMPFNKTIDTAIMYYAGIAAHNIKNREKAVKFFKKTAKLGYEGANSYIMLKNNYLAMGDTTAAMNALKEGFEQYPDNEVMIAGLVNYYLLNSEDPSNALKYLDAAQKQSPNNAEYYTAEAQVYDKMDKEEKAIKNYKKALELDPDSYMANFNLGVIYFNRGVEFENKANSSKEDDVFKKNKELATKEFKKALPYMEKASEQKPNDLSTLNTLKQLYFRLRSLNEKYATEYKKVSKKIEILKKNK